MDMLEPAGEANQYSDYAQRWADHMKPGANAPHTYIEKPAMYSCLPDLAGLSILSLGCGSGEECGELLRRNPSRLVGIDKSEALINLARQSHPTADFFVQDMETLTFDNETFDDEEFDFVYSSLALHYVNDWLPTLRSANRVLKPGGRLQFSVPHPVLWCGEIVRGDNVKSKLLGYQVNLDSSAPRLSIYGDYLNPAAKQETWFGEFAVEYFTKPFGQMFTNLTESGFRVVDVIEPRPTAEALQAAPTESIASYGCAEWFYEIHQRLPLFLILKAEKVS